MKRFIYFTMLVAAVGLQACSSDDPDLPGEDEIDYPVPETDLVNDVVKTTMDAKTCVMATNLEDMGSLFVKRLDNAGADFDDETELLVLDDDACYKFVKDDEEYNRISDYYLRGGIIYLHRPAMGAAYLMARLQYGMSPLKSEEKVSPLAEAYICQISGAEYWGDAVWERDAHNHTYYDEEGNEYKEPSEGDEKPTEYYYGLYAESAAKFVNEVTHNLLRSDTTVVNSRAGTETIAPEQIPIQRTVNMHGKVTYNLAKDKVLEYQMPIDYKFYVRALYSFDQDKDYYELKYSQFIPMSKAFKGHFSFKRKAAYKDKYGGFTFAGHSVEAELCNYNPGVSVYSLEGVLPANEPLEGTEATEKGWNVGGNVSFSGQGGLVIGASGGYSSSTIITVPHKDLPVTYQQKRKDLLSWEYSVSNPMYYFKHRGRNGSYERGSEICEKDITLEQGWGWIVSDTKKQGDTPLKVKLNAKTTIRSGACTSGAGGNTSWNNLSILPQEYEFNLPVPERFSNEYNIVAEPLNDESVRLRTLLMQNSAQFKYTVDHPKRCAVSNQVLKWKMMKEWGEVYDEIRSRGKISNVKEEVTFYLEGSSGQRVGVYGSLYYGIHINKDGIVTLAK